MHNVKFTGYKIRVLWITLEELSCIHTVIFFLKYYVGGSAGWGTALQATKSWVQLPMVSLEFFTDRILPAHYDSGVDSASNGNEYQE